MDCTYCLGDVEYDHTWRVPGIPPEPGEGFDVCHCGHERWTHSYHVLFCRRCPCYSFHRSGEFYDDIHDRWN